MPWFLAWLQICATAHFACGFREKHHNLDQIGTQLDSTASRDLKYDRGSTLKSSMIYCHPQDCDRELVFAESFTNKPLTDDWGYPIVNRTWSGVCARYFEGESYTFRGDTVFLDDGHSFNFQGATQMAALLVVPFSMRYRRSCVWHTWNNECVCGCAQSSGWDSRYMTRCQPVTSARENAWDIIGLEREYYRKGAIKTRERALRAIGKTIEESGNTTMSDCKCYREGICSHCSLSPEVARELLLQVTEVKRLTGGTTAAKLLAIHTAPHLGQEFVVRTFGRKDLINSSVNAWPRADVIAAQIGHMVGTATPRAVVVDFDEKLCRVLWEHNLYEAGGFCKDVNQSFVYRVLVTDLVSREYFSNQVPAILQSTTNHIFAFDLLIGRKDLFLDVWGDQIELNQRNLLKSGKIGSHRVVIDLNLGSLRDLVVCTYNRFRLMNSRFSKEQLSRRQTFTMSSMLKSDADLNRFIQCSMGQVLGKSNVELQGVKQALSAVAAQSHEINSLLDHYATIDVGAICNKDKDCERLPSELILAVKTRLAWIKASTFAVTTTTARTPTISSHAINITSAINTSYFAHAA